MLSDVGASIKTESSVLRSRTDVREIRTDAVCQEARASFAIDVKININGVSGMSAIQGPSNYDTVLECVDKTEKCRC